MEESKKGTQKYEVSDEKLGEGSFGKVYKARDTETKDKVAIKKIGPANEDDQTIKQEINILKDLKHPNVIELRDSYYENGTWHLVFDRMKWDLIDIICDLQTPLLPPDIKSYLQMILRGLAYCHQNNVLHRDLKPDNLLVGDDGTLKLADFGSAHKLDGSNGELSPNCFGRCYRAPELWLGTRQYDGKVDVWAAGCIFAELMLRDPFLAPSDWLRDSEESETDSEIPRSTRDAEINQSKKQLGRIFELLGTPMGNEWPEVNSLPNYMELEWLFSPTNRYMTRPLSSFFTDADADDDALDLLSKMLTYNPKGRISAEEALEHRYFLQSSLATDPSKLPKPSKKRKSRAGDKSPVIHSDDRAHSKRKYDHESEDTK